MKVWGRIFGCREGEFIFQDNSWKLVSPGGWIGLDAYDALQGHLSFVDPNYIPNEESKYDTNNGFRIHKSTTHI